MEGAKESGSATTTSLQINRRRRGIVGFPLQMAFLLTADETSSKSVQSSDQCKAANSAPPHLSSAPPSPFILLLHSWCHGWEPSSDLEISIRIQKDR